ncbi:MAG: hypothetical protein K2F83_06965, partial [Oscillospiraceae bacterium]|nr:hypothetical protein [Oscillospiraceae bacterium]
VRRIALGAIFLMFWFALWFSAEGLFGSGLWPPLTGPWEALKCAWENWQVRQGDAWELVLKDYPVDWNFNYSWNCWEVMRVGDELVCLVRIDLAPGYENPAYYRGRFYFCTYNEDLFTPAVGSFLECVTITPESGATPGEDIWGWKWHGNGTGGFQVSYCDVLVMEGDTYVDVTYDYLGTYATMRCPIVWEPWNTEVEP